MQDLTDLLEQTNGDRELMKILDKMLAAVNHRKPQRG